MAGKKIFIEYDIDASDLKIANGETLNLTQQLRLLKKELQRADLGTKEFEILRQKIGDTEDAIAKTNVKSKDFFGILSSLPGPVGAFGSSISGVVDTLKVFSSFSFNDLKNSLKDIVDDVVQITRSFFGLTTATNTATVATEANIVATNTLTTAQRAATIATTALKLALAALGIGVVIIGITKLIELYDQYIESTNEVKNAQEKLNAELAKTDLILKFDLRKSKADQELRIAQLKAGGATEKEIQDQSLKDLQQNLLARETALAKYVIERERLKQKLVNTEDLELEEIESIQKDLQNVSNTTVNLALEVYEEKKKIQILELQGDIKANENRLAKQKEANDRALAQQKENEQKRLTDTKSAEEQISNLVDEISVLRIKDERTRQFQELEIQKKNEEEKIKQLVISEELKDNLLTQTRIKFKLKNQQLDDKFKEEDIASELEFSRKIEDIQIQAIENTREREDVQRQVKLRRDLENLEKDKNFILLSEEQKETIRQNIRLRYINETNELIKSREKQAKDDRLKFLDDELRFLQIRQDAIRVNTKAFFDGQRDILEASQKRELEAAEGKERELTAIKEKYSKLRKDLDEQETLATIQAIGQTIQSFATLTAALASGYDEEAKTSKKAFDQRKKLQIATATMSAASGIIQILTQPSTLPSPFDWITKGINAVALGITTGVQIGNIKKTQFEGSAGGGTGGNRMGRGYADGGLVTGPGTSTSDSIPARLSNGEAVMTAGAVTMFAPMLSMMNQMGGGTSFSNQVTNTLPDKAVVSNPSQEPVIMKTYVVESELTSSQQRQARLKNLSTL